MEPTLTPPDPADDPLEALLRADPPPIADDGFTQHVCSALPPHPTNVPFPLRALVLAGALLLGCVLVWAIEWRIDFRMVARATEPLFTGKLQPWHALVVGAIVAAWGLVDVLREDRVSTLSPVGETRG